MALKIHSDSTNWMSPLSAQLHAKRAFLGCSAGQADPGVLGNKNCFQTDSLVMWRELPAVHRRNDWF